MRILGKDDRKDGNGKPGDVLEDYKYLEIADTGTPDIMLVLRRSFDEAQEGVSVIALDAGINSVERLKIVLPQAFVGVSGFEIVEKNKPTSDLALTTQLFEPNSVVIRTKDMFFDTVVQRLNLGLGKIT